MGTMHMIRLLTGGMMTAVLFLSSPLLAQSTFQGTVTSRASEDAGFEAFRASQGWVFVEDLSKAEGLPDLDGVPAVEPTGEAFSAERFDPERFDPREYVILVILDPNKPTNYRVGDRGVIQFHSDQRVRELYRRHLRAQPKSQQ